MADNVYTHIRIRRDTLENWQNENPILKLGELSVVLGESYLNGVDYDVKLKIGDGEHTWRQLRYVNEDNYSRVESLIKLLFNVPFDSNVTIKGNVYNFGDLITAFPPNKCNDGDIAYVISEKKFYYFSKDDGDWHVIDAELAGTNIDRNEVIKIINEVIGNNLNNDNPYYPYPHDPTLPNWPEGPNPFYNETDPDNPKPYNKDDDPTGGNDPSTGGRLYPYSRGTALEKRVSDLEYKTSADKSELVDTINNIYKKDKSITQLRIHENYGNDETGNGSTSKPFKTILGALNYISPLIGRNITNIELILLSNLILTDMLYIPCINGLSKLTLNGNRYSITINNNETNGFEIYSTTNTVFFNEVSFIVGGRSPTGVYCGIGTKTIFTNCKFSSLYNGVNSLVKIDSLSNAIFDTCEFTGVANDNAIYTIDSSIYVRNCKTDNTKYAISSRNSFSTVSNNNFNCLVKYFNRIDNSEVVA